MSSAESPKHLTTDYCARDMADEAGGIQVFVNLIPGDGETMKCGNCELSLNGGESTPEDAAVQVAEHCLFYGPNKIFDVPKD